MTGRNGTAGGRVEAGGFGEAGGHVEVGGFAEAGEAGEDAGVAAERERLSRQLRDTRMQLAMTEARLSALEQSATMRFGRTIANAAKKPWPRGALLPRDLFKLWRDRGAPKTGAANAATALASAQLADLKGTGGRFLSALTAPGATPVADPARALAGTAGSPDGLVVTGALSALGCATLAPDAVVHPLLPHDADIVVEGTGADVVVVQASALLPGEPWAHATDPAAADRGRRLARMIIMARSLGKPVILIRDVPHSLMPGIGWLAASCDAVLDGGFGVQLARFNPVGVTSARPTSPVYAGERDPREAPAVRALLDALTGTAREGSGSGAVRLTGARSWRSLPALYRDHAVFVTASAEQGREQVASGAQVIGPLSSGLDAATVRGQLEAARGARPLSLTEIRARLRDISVEHSTPARLAALVKAAGLPASLVSGRQIGVLTAVTDTAQASRLAATLLGQRLRPSEVVAGCPAGTAGAVRAAFSTLTGHGIRVEVTDAPLPGPAAPSPGADWARPLTRLATAPWLALWAADGGQPDTHLLDLAGARECAQADAVGFAAGEFEFTRWLEEPALVRAALLEPGGPAAGDWGRHGLRLFTITPERAAGQG
ncbi:hypothetical protein EAS64_14480 [Trebonia kvetii]|uniref:Uncharacterized protein n=1 Tax=Trebonia kvetii TaxID=2480626 RepID=A0A6P2C423_9ACTN|nr:hypothetical protein [Trebonia kvetii]TVZ05697.1 hypothetical protein EAS64_14480 [Trebonia kvetii]